MDDVYFKRKENLVIKDFETAFKCYDKLIGKIASIRQWNVTVMVAMIVFTLANNTPRPDMAIPVIIFFFATLALELRERSSMRFDKQQILELERIFMLKDQKEYEARIENYLFRDLVLRDLGRKSKVMHLIKSIGNNEVIFWYTIWIFIWVTIIAIKY